MMTTVLVLILVPVMYSFFGTSAREEHTDEYAAGFGASAESSAEPDAAEREWLPAGSHRDAANRWALIPPDQGH
jgi:hypothetical protein